jgi:hypothetical protein
MSRPRANQPINQKVKKGRSFAQAPDIVTCKVLPFLRTKRIVENDKSCLKTKTKGVLTLTGILSRRKALPFPD